jgi:hypothetical protein
MRGAGALIVGLFAGPVGAALVWKGLGAALNGNPMHLLPGMGGVAEGLDALDFDGPDSGGDDWWRRHG